MFLSRSPFTRLRLTLVGCMCAAGLTAGCAGGHAAQKTSTSPSNRTGGASAQQAGENEKSVREWFVLGNRRLDNDDYAGAIRAYDSAVDVDPEFWRAHLNRGIALSADNQFDAAVRAFEQALVRGGRDQPTVYFNLGNAYQNRGMFDRAVEVYRAGLAHCDKPHLDMLVNLAGAYALSGDRPAARSTYEYIQRLAPQDARAPYGLGIVAYFNNNPQRAIDLLNQANALDGSLAAVYFTRGRLHQRLGHSDKAAADYAKYLELAPAGAFRRRAQTYLNQLDTDANR